MSTSDGSAVASLSLQEKPSHHDEVCREPDAGKIAQAYLPLLIFDGQSDNLCIKTVGSSLFLACTGIAGSQAAL